MVQNLHILSYNNRHTFIWNINLHIYTHPYIHKQTLSEHTHRVHNYKHIINNTKINM